MKIHETIFYEKKDIEQKEPTKEKYPFDRHKIYASFWCNSNIISELTKILGIYEGKHIESVE